jgi:TubC N-terminal docking domain
MIHALIADLAAKKVVLKIEDDQLIVDGPESEVTDDLVGRLRLFKPDLMRALSSSPISRDAGVEAGEAEVKALKQGAACSVIDEWIGEDWRAFFDERAGIAEFDGELPRPQAETQAFECCVVEWLNRNSVRSAPGRCVGCGTVEDTARPLLPMGTERNGHVWLHSGCWEAWRTARRAEAVATLAAMGIIECQKETQTFTGSEARRVEYFQSLGGNKQMKQERKGEGAKSSKRRHFQNGVTTLTEEQILTMEEFRASRKKAALEIDPETAEVDWWYAQTLDPYEHRP